MSAMTKAEYESLLNSTLKTRLDEQTASLKKDYEKSFKDNIAPVQKEITALSKNHKELSDSYLKTKKETDSTIAQLKEEVRNLSSKQEALIQSHRLVQSEVTNIGDRMRRNNLRFTHMMTASKSFEDCSRAIQKLLFDAINLTIVETEFQRAHIVGSSRNLEDVTLIACFFNSKLKDKILRSGADFKEHCELHEVHTKISNDYTKDTLFARQMLFDYAIGKKYVGFLLRYDRLEHNNTSYEYLNGKIIPHSMVRNETNTNEAMETDDQAGAVGGESSTNDAPTQPKQRRSELKCTLDDILNNKTTIQSVYYPISNEKGEAFNLNPRGNNGKRRPDWGHRGRPDRRKWHDNQRDRYYGDIPPYQSYQHGYDNTDYSSCSQAPREYSYPPPPTWHTGFAGGGDFPYRERNDHRSYGPRGQAPRGYPPKRGSPRGGRPQKPRPKKPESLNKSVQRSQNNNQTTETPHGGARPKQRNDNKHVATNSNSRVNDELPSKCEGSAITNERTPLPIPTQSTTPTLSSSISRIPSGFHKRSAQTKRLFDSTLENLNIIKKTLAPICIVMDEPSDDDHSTSMQNNSKRDRSNLKRSTITHKPIKWKPSFDEPTTIKDSFVVLERSFS